MNAYHIVRPADRERIRCYHNGCKAPSYVCEHAKFNTCGIKGISFWYYCAKHTPQ